EARVPHRRGRRVRRLARRIVADLACRRRRPREADRRRQGVQGHDPQARVVRVRAAERRAACTHTRRPPTACAAARVLHPGGRRNDGVFMTSLTELQRLDADNAMQTYGRLPVAFVRGEGTKLWDSEGNEYLDFLTGLAV